MPHGIQFCFWFIMFVLVLKYFTMVYRPALAWNLDHRFQYSHPPFLICGAVMKINICLFCHDIFVSAVCSMCKIAWAAPFVRLGQGTSKSQRNGNLRKMKIHLYYCVIHQSLDVFSSRVKRHFVKLKSSEYQWKHLPVTMTCNNIKRTQISTFLIGLSWL